MPSMNSIFRAKVIGGAGFLGLVFTVSAQTVPVPVYAKALPGGMSRNAITFSPMDSSNPLFFPVVAWGSGMYNANSAAVADLNGDGKPDVVAANTGFASTVTEGAVEVLMGNGDGTFQQQVSYDSGGTAAFSVAIADFNGDGKLDLAVANGCGTGTWGVMCSSQGVVGILLGNGDGTFQPPVTYGSGGWNNYGAQIVVADFNGDGKPDLLVSSCAPIGSQDCGNGVVSVLLGKGDGTFASAVSYSPGGFATSSVAAGDVNGDGKPDIIAANRCVNASNCTGTYTAEGSVGVLLGNGDGTFQAAVTYDSGGTAASAVAVKDVNGDGKPDVLVGGCEPGGCGGGPAEVAVLLGNGDGSFQSARTYASTSVLSVATGDVNGDGKVDLVVASLENGAGILLGNGNGTFQAEQTYDTVSSAESVVLADLNGDGKPDLVAGTNCWFRCGGSGPIGVLLNVGNHIFTTTSVVSSLNPSVIGNPVTLTVTVSSSKGKPRGVVILTDNSTALGSLRLSSGSASFTLSSLTQGVHSIDAAYQGLGNFLPSNATTLNQVVNEPPTLISLVSSADPVEVNHSVTFTASVTSFDGRPLTGHISFIDNGKLVAQPPILNNGAAYAVSYTLKGEHVVRAIYSGDANNALSISDTLIEAADSFPVATKATISSSGSPAPIGAPVVFTATVIWTFGHVPDGEFVTFTEAGVPVATVALSGGVATYTATALSAKTHGIKVTYAGDSTFSPSSASMHEVIELYPTSTTLVSSQNPSSGGQAVTFTVTVVSKGQNVPTGKVLFKNGAQSIGTVGLSGGVANLTKSTLAAGSHSITATYEGDAVSTQSTATPLVQVVN